MAAPGGGQASSQSTRPDGSDVGAAAGARADAEGASADGESADGASADGASKEGASAVGASADGASADGASADGASADGAPSVATPKTTGMSKPDGAEADRPFGRAGAGELPVSDSLLLVRPVPLRAP